MPVPMKFALRPTRILSGVLAAAFLVLSGVLAAAFLAAVFSVSGPADTGVIPHRIRVHAFSRNSPRLF